MQRNENDQRGSLVPENNSSKAMDSKKDVEQSDDGKIDQDFPGYPHYPGKEDIMDQRTDAKRVDVDVENIPNSRNNSGIDQRFLAGQNGGKAEKAMTPQPGSGDDNLDLRMGNEADVNEDDLAILN